MNNEKELEDALHRLCKEYKLLMNSQEYIQCRKIYTILTLINNFSIGKFLEVLKRNYLDYTVKKFDRTSQEYLTYDDSIDTKTKKIAIYTCVTGGVDKLREPLYRPHNVDFIAYTDRDIVKKSVWECRNININPEVSQLDNARKNRYIKLHPYKFLTEYEYSIYVDTNIKIIGDLSRYIKCLAGKIPMAVNWHPKRNCLYSEAAVCKLYKKDNPDTIDRQIKAYQKEGMPYEFGLAEGGMIIRRHMDHICIDLMEKWWEEIKIWSVRDQISLPYAVWKLGYTMRDLGFISNNLRMIDELVVTTHDK